MALSRAEYFQEYRRRPEVRAKQKERNRTFCANNPERCREYRKRYNQKHPDKVRAGQRRRKLRHLYGIEEHDYQRLLQEQGGRCAICGGQDEQHLSVDHDHSTGEIRGLLCRQCNLVIGNAQEDPNILEASMRYLEKHGRTI